MYIWIRLRAGGPSRFVPAPLASKTSCAEETMQFISTLTAILLLLPAIALAGIDAKDREPSTEAKAESASAADEATGEGTGKVGGEAEDEAEDDEEAEQPGTASATDEIRYTKDLSDAELERRWRESPESLGSISVGLTNRGRLVHGVQFPRGDQWIVVEPAKAFGTQETIDFLAAAIAEVNTRFPGTHPMRVNHLSRKDGGYIRPHKTHQSGRDIDVGFYSARGEAMPGTRLESMDLDRNWAFVRALVMHTDIEAVLINKKGAKKMHDFARSIGEDPAWLDAIFNAGQASIVKGVRRHRDHFHLRFYSPRAQELGRRIQPLLGKGKDENNFTVHQIRRGDTLGSLARKHQSTVAAIKKENGLKSSALRVGRAINIPIKGPCVNCPVPPPLVVPPRRLPPSTPMLMAGRAQEKYLPPLHDENPVLERLSRQNSAFLPTIRALCIPQVY